MFKSESGWASGRPALMALTGGLVSLAVFGVLPVTAGAMRAHHYRHHRLFHGLSKPAPPVVTISHIQARQVVDNSPGTEVVDNFGPLDVTVSRTGATHKPLTVTLITTDGTAVAGTDFTGGPYTVTIPRRQTSTVVSIPILDEESTDENEDFSVSLANPSAGTVSGDPQTVTIVNDDQSGAFTVHNGETITLGGELGGCDVLTERFADLSDHSALTTGTTSNGCPDMPAVLDSWTNSSGHDVSVGVQLVDNTCFAAYESDDQAQDPFDNGGDWFTGDHVAVWTALNGVTHVAITDAAGCTDPANREPGTGDPGNLTGSINITPGG
jgi:hypothetical protein